jgi:hypothetical protein
MGCSWSVFCKQLFHFFFKGFDAGSKGLDDGVVRCRRRLLRVDALQAAPGEPLVIEFIRRDQRLTLTVTPQAMRQIEDIIYAEYMKHEHGGAH